MRKKLTALLLVTVMLLSLAACGGESSVGEVANNEPLTKDDVIKMVINSHPSWPYNENWKIWEYIADGSGVTLDVTAIVTDPGTKYSIMFASPDTLPDVVGFSYKPDTDKYVNQGALVAFEDVEAYMPNYIAWRESLSEEEIQNNIKARRAADGKIYYSPVIGRERSQNVRAWLYRKDIFDKHGLKVPETFDELYDVSKKLKELYPESYPLCMRSGMANMGVSGSSWKPYWTPGFYYDFDAEKWCYGVVEETMREVLAFYYKMVQEKLIPTDFITINASGWQELIVTDRGFIMPEYQTRIDFFNSLARGNNPEFNLAAMVPPVANPETGVAMVSKNNIDPVGFTIANSGNEKRVANAAKFLDWFYTDKAMELVSWGKEGETFEVVDGKKKFITDENGTQANSLYGFSTYGTFTRMDPEAVAAFESNDIAESVDMVLEHTLPYANPTTYLAFTDEERKVMENFSTGLSTYAESMIMKFILGQEPLSSFDSFAETIKNDFNLDDLLEAYESAYSRVK